MRSKKFDYKQHGRGLVEWVQHQERQGQKKSYKFWESWGPHLQQYYGGDRNPTQWARIYYTARAKIEKQRATKPGCWILTIKEADAIINRLAEIDRKLDQLLAR